MITLAECGTWLSGGTPSKANEGYWNGTLPWFSSKDIRGHYLDDSELHVSEAGAEAGSHVVPPGTILMVVRGMSLANEFRVGMTRVRASFNQDLKGLVLKKGLVPHYIVHALRALEPQILARTDSAAHGTKRLATDILQSFSVPLLDPAEQERIADVLDRADALRKKRREAMALTDKLLRVTFLEMFGDPVANPKGWPREIFGALADVSGGLQVTSTRSAHSLQAPYLRVANVHRGRLDLDEIKQISLSPEELERTTLRRGDLLFVEGHGNEDEIGRCAMWNNEIPGCVHQNHIIRARTSPKLLPEYAMSFMNSAGGRRYFSRHRKTTSGLYTISANTLRRAPMLLPPLHVQQRFVDVLRGLRSRAPWFHDSESAFSTLFASLQHRAFRGEL